jgi:hypothetical protein
MTSKGVAMEYEKLADRIFEAENRAHRLEDEFGRVTMEILGLDDEGDWPFADFHFDSYDKSFELDGCEVSLGLTQEQQAKFWDLGFLQCWLNYHNGTQNHYYLDSGKEYK